MTYLTATYCVTGIELAFFGSVGVVLVSVSVLGVIVWRMVSP